MAIESLNPTTGELLRKFPEMGREEVDAILTAAVKAQKAWARTSFAERAVPMRRVAALLRERAPELARLAAVEMGKPLKDGKAEAEKCAWVCDFYAENAERFLAPRPETSDGSQAYVRFDPLGVVLAVMPWNFPYWQVFRFIAPHLMAGNGGLLKHASNVPQCALAIETLMHDAGFPRDLFRTLLVGSKPVRGIILDDRIAAATITGSEPAGRAVAAAAGECLKPSVMELGGSDPFIVLADADLDAAAKTAAVARTINAGQSCICAKRFIVEAPVYDAFLQKFTDAMKAVKVGDPTQPGVDIGPQARADLRDEMHGLVRQAVDEGARVVMGCTVPPGPGAFYPVSILADVRPGNVAAREELFGPVAVVMKAATADEAVEIANDSRFGLGASLWTRDPATIERLVPRIEAGAVFVNGMVKSDPRLPFGGVKTSGYGRELGLEGIRAFVNVKTVWVR
ncbi:MAG TPA: NAD-dependent succinate-semialdehyde dehydrogenase [Anaeromyxobacteraceae bacterium]|nr:NAD-dependent succinate-semialdehyde dehydrogenase [Anaeromyxobacteraceae bacterium]